MDYAVGGGLNRSNHGHEHGKETRRPVRVTSLDEWAASVSPGSLEHPPPFLFVKLDIEGTATAALAGGRRLLQHATHVLIGIHDDDEWAAARKPVGGENTRGNHGAWSLEVEQRGDQRVVRTHFLYFRF